VTNITNGQLASTQFKTNYQSQLLLAIVAGNYVLSGSAGFSGNVKTVELLNAVSVLQTVESFVSMGGDDIIYKLVYFT
jgi:hypothetical protein